MLHPIFIPLLATLVYFNLNENYFVIEQVYLVLIQVSIIMVFIPICFFYLLRTLGRVDSVMLEQVSQRKLPLSIYIVLTALLIAKSITVDLIPELYYFFLGALTSSGLALALAFVKIKASLHQMGIMGLLAFAVGLSMHNQTNALFVIAALALASGIVAASRLEMDAHTGKELVIGGLCGIVPQIALWCFWL
ncbi:hypothetical protein SAMN02927903_01137 [Flavobacterium caeni]|uniref:Uncharacterized protein n=1 Tax=Flavobacterium caeni TaxID=490189 RepID=A0A1G5EQH8_9FLAO|nr:hypothetical protein SAMN02927903_01137 [Flavobacterium caeni]